MKMVVPPIEDRTRIRGEEERRRRWRARWKEKEERERVRDSIRASQQRHAALRSASGRGEVDRETGQMIISPLSFPLRLFFL